MKPADIAESFSSGTNVVHYAALEILAKMAESLGKKDFVAKKIEGLEKVIKTKRLERVFEKEISQELYESIRGVLIDK